MESTSFKLLTVLFLTTLCIGSVTAVSETVNWINIQNMQVTGNDIEGTCTNWCSGGGISSQEISSGDGYVEFTIAQRPDNTYSVIGLSNGDTNYLNSDVDFSITLSGNWAEVRENAAYKSDSSLNVGDVFRVAVVNGQVEYSKNGNVFYTSSAPVTYPLLVDTAMNGNPSTVPRINNVNIETGAPSGPVCGNDVAETGEECDGLDLSSETCASQGFNGGPLSCTSSCTLDTSACTTNPVCGDGVIGGSEVCDDGALNGQPNQCNLNCTGTTPSICGNDITEAGEVCDGNAQACTTGAGYAGNQNCVSQCTGFDTCVTAEFCGDGTRNGNEQCDDNNNLDGDGCSAICETEFTGLDDGFDDDVFDPSWTVVNGNEMTLSEFGGDLHIVPTDFSVWFFADTGPLVYKNLTGDFRVTTSTQTRKVSNPGEFPDNGFQFGGIMVRDPAGDSTGIENYVFNLVGYRDIELSIETKTTTNDVSTVRSSPWPTGDAELRICRIGSDYHLYKRELGATNWSFEFSYSRPDIPSTVQVGLTSYSQGIADIEAMFDFVKFEPVNDINDCTLDAPTGPVCGNGVVEGSEICDDGALNGQPNQCNLSCTGPTPNQPPTLNPIGDQQVNEGQTLSFVVNGTDPELDNLTYSASNLPIGSTFDTQTFTWTTGFVDAGVYTNVSFTVSDGEFQDTEEITITVNNVNTAPSSPTSPSVDSVTSSSATTSWTASTDDVGVTNYNVYRDNVLVGTPTVTSFTDPGLNSSTNYSYEVSAVDDEGAESGRSSPVIAVTQNGLPTVPTNLQVTSTTTSTVTITWTASTDDVDVVGYNMYRDNILVGTPTVTSFTDTGLNSSTNYTYEISAFDVEPLESGRSSPVVGETQQPPDVTPPSVSWVSPVDSEVVSGTISLDVSAFDNVGVTRVEFFVDGVSIGQDTVAPYSVVFNTSTVGDGIRTLTAFASDAVNNTGNATISVDVFNIIPNTPPTVPTNLNTVTVSSTDIDLTWTASTDNNLVAGYNVYRDTVLVANTTGVSFTDTGLIPGTNFTYEVSAFDDLSLESNRSIAVVGSTGASPVLTLIVVSPSSVTLASGTSMNFDAQGTDQYGDPFSTTFTWSVEQGSSIDQTGSFTAGLQTVTATSGSISGSATVIVT